MVEQKGPWNYDLPLIHYSDEGEPIIKVNLPTYLLMADELSDRIRTLSPYTNRILYSKGSYDLAIIVGRTTSTHLKDKQQPINFNSDSPESFEVNRYDNIVVLANENGDGAMPEFVATLSLLFKPESITSAVLFQNTSVKSSVDITIVSTDNVILLPIEVSMDDISYPSELQKAANDLVNFMLGDKQATSLNLHEAEEKLRKNGFDTDRLPNLNDYYFAKLLISSFKERYKKLYPNLNTNSKLLISSFPGINQEALEDNLPVFRHSHS